jgi:hypothetical protein
MLFSPQTDMTWVPANHTHIGEICQDGFYTIRLLVLPSIFISSTTRCNFWQIHSWQKQNSWYHHWHQLHSSCSPADGAPNQFTTSSSLGGTWLHARPGVSGAQSGPSNLQTCCWREHLLVKFHLKIRETNLQHKMYSSMLTNYCQCANDSPCKDHTFK